MEILRSPDYFHIIKSIQVTRYEVEEEIQYFYKAKIILKDNSELHATEYFNFILQKHDYSFHWQKANGELIKRWDNSFHHKRIKGFPFHLHLRDKIIASREVTLEDVLSIIFAELKKRF